MTEAPYARFLVGRNLSLNPLFALSNLFFPLHHVQYETIGLIHPIIAVQYKLGKHRSNALSLLQQQDIIMVDGDMAVCDGGGGALGHPLEYIKLGVRQDIGEGSEAEGIRCLYCGLRYRSKAHH